MTQKAVHWLEQMMKKHCGEEFTRLNKQWFDKAKQIEHDTARYIAYNAYCRSQVLEPSEGDFNKFFKEMYDENSN